MLVARPEVERALVLRCRRCGQHLFKYALREGEAVNVPSGTLELTCPRHGCHGYNRFALADLQATLLHRPT